MLEANACRSCHECWIAGGTVVVPLALLAEAVKGGETDPVRGLIDSISLHHDASGSLKARDLEKLMRTYPYLLDRHSRELSFTNVKGFR